MMKAQLFELEKEFTKAALAEAGQILRQLREYTFHETRPGQYECISSAPDFHVTAQIKADGSAWSECDCAPYRKYKECKHALAVLILIRDQQPNRKQSSHQSRANRMSLDQLLPHVRVNDLRQFIKDYAATNTPFRLEFMARFLYLAENPDYTTLLQESLPVNAKGKPEINRRTTKSIRYILNSLLLQTEQYLKDKSPGQAYQLLKAVFPFLYRIHPRIKTGKTWVLNDLRRATQLFDDLTRLEMAPSLKDQLIELALETTDRDGYFIPAGFPPLLALVHPFVHDDEGKIHLLHVIENKLHHEPDQRMTWGHLLFHSMRKWEHDSVNLEVLDELRKTIPALIRQAAEKIQHEDVLFMAQYYNPSPADPIAPTEIYSACLRSARALKQQDLALDLAKKLAFDYLDIEAWDWLTTQEPDQAEKILHILVKSYSPGQSPKAEALILHGHAQLGQIDALWMRLQSFPDMELMIRFDHVLLKNYRSALVEWYADQITQLHDSYGGQMARQKLSHIFGHLKGTGLHEDVQGRIKHLQQTKRPL